MAIFLSRRCRFEVFLIESICLRNGFFLWRFIYKKQNENNIICFFMTLSSLQLY